MGANEELLARRHQAVVRGVSYATPLFADRALNKIGRASCRERV